MRTALLVVLVLAGTTAAGCIAPDGTGGFFGGSDPATDAEQEQIPWPDLADAVIRPGVRVASDSGTCTSNFVFRSADNATLYLGLAAHCLPGDDEEEKVRIADSVEGTVAYNSWRTMEGGDFPDVSTSENDFALIRIDDADRHLVHPALFHFGGPTGLATDAGQGDRILTYGNTPLRDGLEPANTREGYVIDSTKWYTRMYIVTPGVPGDSGSAVVNADGQALGVLIHLGILPFVASNGAVNLAAALEFANEHAEIEVELATWELLAPGLLPDLP